jgi:two-component system phosphate regulon sensor histidine kinase PhoR
MGRREKQRYLTFRGILFVLLFVVVAPVALLTSAGIVAIILGRETVALVTGILILSLTAAVFTGVFIILLLLRRGIRLAREQEAFLSNVTHELRTPLTAIRMYTQTLRMGRVSDQKKVDECLDTILTESVRLERLIERVLQWRRIAEGKQAYQMVTTTIQAPVSDALENFNAMVGAEEVDLQVDVRMARNVLIADRTAVADVVLNLLHNAFKYTGQNKKISLTATDVDGGVELSVSDNGVGIPEEYQARIFDRFYRAVGGPAGKISGTGLGLSLVKHVMDFHRGKIDVQSEVGKGSVFKIFFPAGKEAEKAT